MLKIFLTLLFVVASSCNCSAFFGRTGQVLSGDTFIVNDNGSEYTIRLYGVDAPDEGQLGNTTSTEYLKSILKGTDSRVVVIPVGHKMDGAGRFQSVVYKDGICVNEQMVSEGQAWYYSKECKIQECTMWNNLEKEARKFRRGIWAIPGAVAPWVYRESKAFTSQNKNEGYLEGVYYRNVNGVIVAKDPNEADLFAVWQMRQSRFNFEKPEKVRSTARAVRSNDFNSYMQRKYDILEHQAGMDN